MRSAVSALVLALITLLAMEAKSAPAAELVIGAVSDEFHAYVDIGSIEKKDGYVVAWVENVPRHQKARRSIRRQFESPSADHYAVLFAYDRAVRQYQMLELTVYDDANQEVLNRSMDYSPERYKKISPGSMGDKLYSFIMSKVQ